LVDSLAAAIELTPLPLTAQAVGNAFYGLQGMSSDRAEVRRVLRALTQKVKEMPVPHLQHLYPHSALQNNSRSSSSDNGGDGGDGGVVSAGEWMKSDGKIDFTYMMTGQNIGNALWYVPTYSSTHVIYYSIRVCFVCVYVCAFYPMSPSEKSEFMFLFFLYLRTGV
jgi:hypothetical protein